MNILLNRFFAWDYIEYFDESIFSWKLLLDILLNQYCGQKWYWIYKPVYRVASQLKKLVNMGGGGVECEEIKLAGVRAELGNTYLCNNIQCKVAGRVC